MATGRYNHFVDGLEKIGLFPCLSSAGTRVPRAHSRQPGEGQLRFVISFVFWALLVDSRGRRVPLLASHPRRWSAVLRLCSHYGANRPRSVQAHRAEARWHAGRVQVLSQCTSVTLTSASFMSCRQSPRRQLEDGRRGKGEPHKSQAETANRVWFHVVWSACSALLSSVRVCPVLSCGDSVIIPFSPHVFDTWQK